MANSHSPYFLFKQSMSNLIKECLEGKEWAHEEFYNLHATYIYAVIKNYINNNEQRKDAMQEAFAQIFLSLKTFDVRKGNIKSWMAKIAARKSIDLIRKESKNNLFYGLEVVKDYGEYTFDYLDHLSRKEIEFLLSKMPSGYRNVFLLAVIDDFTHDEIAKMLGISTVTSRSQLLRAKKWIQKNLSYSLNKLINERVQYAKK